MATYKCPVCGKNIEVGARFCSWCGASLSSIDTHNGESEDEKHHEWPEEEKSVSFTIYDANDNSLNGESEYPMNQIDRTGWRAKHYVILFLMLLFTTGVLYFLLYYKVGSAEIRMPNYENVIQKQNTRQERRDEKIKAQQQEEERIKEELRRAEEQAALEAAERERELEMEDEDLIDLDVIEERLQEFFE